jgi:hypothetical protein
MLWYTHQKTIYMFIYSHIFTFFHMFIMICWVRERERERELERERERGAVWVRGCDVVGVG